MSVIATFIRNKATTPASAVQRLIVFCIDFLQMTVHVQHVVKKKKDTLKHLTLSNVICFCVSKLYQFATLIGIYKYILQWVYSRVQYITSTRGSFYSTDLDYTQHTELLL